MTATSRQADSSGDVVSSVQRALSVLELLAAEHGGGLGVSQVAELLGLSPSTAHRLLRNVQARGYVAQDPRTRLYRLGPKVAQLGAAFVEHTNLRSLAYPHLRQLADSTGETVNLAILSGAVVVKVACLESSSPVRPAGAALRNENAHASALGKVLLAAIPDGELVELVARAGLQRFTDRTITSCHRLLEALAEVRVAGYATDDEESWEGVCCSAAPVRDCYGQVIAAVGVAVPKQRADGGRLLELTRAAVGAARAISADLGFGA